MKKLLEKIAEIKNLLKKTIAILEIVEEVLGKFPAAQSLDEKIEEKIAEIK